MIFSVTVFTQEHNADHAMSSRGVVLRNACQGYGVLKSGCQRWWPTQPIRLACLSQEHWMEDVYCVHRMVHNPDRNHLLLFPRNQKSNCKYLRSLSLQYILTFLSSRNSTTSLKLPTRSRSHWRRSRCWSASTTVLLLSRRLWFRCFDTALAEHYCGDT